MAERRMFSKSVTDSDSFLDMSATAQLLYFHLSMHADDDGFLKNPKSIMRMVGGNNDDLSLLVAKQFLIPFESGVVVIKHWKIHNYIAKDRYKPSDCEEKEMVTLDKNVYSLCTNCIQPVYELDTQDRLGKDRLGKDRLGKDRLGKDRLGKDRLGNNIYNPPTPLAGGETSKKKPKPNAVEINVRLFNQLIDNYSFTEQMREKILDWFMYKAEMKKDFKERGAKSLFTEIANNVHQYGEDAVIGAINKTMSNGYQGIVWDYCKETKGNKSGSAYIDAINNRYDAIGDWLKDAEKEKNNVGT